MRQFLLIIVIALSACSSPPNVANIVLYNVNGQRTSIHPQNNQLTIIYFLSPECPLCVNYTLAMRNLEQEFAADSIKFYGVFSKAWFSPKEVRDFAAKYKLNFDMLFDPDNQLARALSATVTPEVFMLNADATVLYAGKIDNWVNELGKKKLEVSEKYLENALLAWRNGQPIKPKHTEPIGCLIE